MALARFETIPLAAAGAPVCKVLILAVGGQGVVQPCIALGHGFAQMKDTQFDVTIAADVDYQASIEATGVPFTPLHANLDIVGSEFGLYDLTPATSQKLAEVAPRLLPEVIRAAESKDVIVFGGILSAVMCYTVLDHFADLQYALVLFQPGFPSKSVSPPGGSTNCCQYFSRNADWKQVMHNLQSVMQLSNYTRTRELGLPPISQVRRLIVHEVERFRGGFSSLAGLADILGPSATQSLSAHSRVQ
jgi:hypothetical protein